MPDPRFLEWLETEVDSIRKDKLYKSELVITSPEQAEVQVDGGTMLNLCANNYLGLANHPEIVSAARRGLESHGFGMASVRFICGTQDLHKQLEARISDFLGTGDTILYGSCFDANAGIFETLLGPEDAIISDALNHASIIDGIRLSKAKRHVYRHADMRELETALKEATSARFRLIVTDGVFSMQGDLAPLDDICDLANRYNAILMVDDSHATGFVGPAGRGTAEHFGVSDDVDIITSTLGKALGGASGGFTSGRPQIVELLRQRSRPYLFSNTLAPPIAAAAIRALDLIDEHPELREALFENTRYFRNAMVDAGFTVIEGIHPIVPVMIGDEKTTVELARQLNARGIFVVGFSYPVVPRGEARTRVQLSAAHTRDQLDHAIAAFVTAGHELGVIQRAA